MVLEVDPDKRRISLGLKQTLANPWETFAEKYPGRLDHRRRGQEQDRVRPVRRPRRRCRRHGPPLATSTGRSRARKPSRTTTAATWSRPRCSTSMSRRSASRSASSSCRPRSAPPKPRRAASIKKGAVVTGTVTEVTDGGIEVRIADSDKTAFIRRADLSRDRNDQRPERFAKGDKVDARVTTVDRKTGKIGLSIKALEIAEEKEAVAAVRLVGLGRFARRHPRRGPQGPREEVSLAALQAHIRARALARSAGRSFHGGDRC